MGSARAPSKPKIAMAPPAGLTFAGRWWGKLLLLLASAALLDISFAPFNQFYLAYVALVPWLIVVRESRSWLTAFFWGWVGGVIFFDLNMWWLAYVTGPGLAGLMAVLGLYWGAVAAIIRGTRLLEPKGLWQRGASAPGAPPCPWAAVANVLLIASVWTCLEWLHGTWPLGGLAWAFVGHSQSRFPLVCQIADWSGVYGVSFVVLMVDACIALLVIHRSHLRRLVPATVCVGFAFAAVLGYGVFRFSQQTTRVGPTVLVVQPNYPQSNSGEKGAEPDAIAAFHIRQTRQALSRRSDVDLVVWSETMMPPLNPEGPRFLMSLRSESARDWAGFLNEVNAQLEKLAAQYHTSLLTGGMYQNDWTIKNDSKGNGRVVAMDRRNSAYFYTPLGVSPLRYDKIHLVPFGEYLPFQSTIPPLYRLFLALSPYDAEYTLTAGPAGALTVFQLPSGQRFVTPICFEDLDGDLVRRMFKPESGQGKRADFIVNITNDGWFRFNEMPQHFQAAVFRSIENRVPTARSVNTGVSGFIDSLGRVSEVIPAGQEGTSIATLRLDDRVTFYTRFGDLFVYACIAVTILLVLWGVIRWRTTRRGADPG
jgi:apolipoprotein N-acyltransferase